MKSHQNKFYQNNENTTDVWLTPPTLIQSLGFFDLDPCCPNNLPWKTAEKFFSLENGEDGLELPWVGQILLTNFPDISVYDDICQKRNAQNANGYSPPTISIKDLIESLEPYLDVKNALDKTTGRDLKKEVNFITEKSDDNIKSWASKNAQDASKLMQPRSNFLAEGMSAATGFNLGAEIALENTQEKKCESVETILAGLSELEKIRENIPKVLGGGLLRNDVALEKIISADNDIYLFPLTGPMKCGRNVSGDGDINVLAAEKVKRLLKSILSHCEIPTALGLFHKICCHIASFATTGNTNLQLRDWMKSFDISKAYSKTPYAIQIKVPLRAYVNPPYSNWVPFLKKLKESGDGIALISARTETKGFFDHVWDDADSILFVKKRIKFVKTDLSVGGSSTAASVLIAYGESNTKALERSGIEGKLIKLK